MEDTQRPILLCLLELTVHLQQQMALYSDPAVGVTVWQTLPGLFCKQACALSVFYMQPSLSSL